MKQSLNIYYKLSEILNYDTYKVATVLDVYLNLNDTEHIFSKLQSLCLDEFEVALNELDKAPGVDSGKVETQEESAQRDNLTVAEKETASEADKK
jgi:hypothetical protein